MAVHPGHPHIHALCPPSSQPRTKRQDKAKTPTRRMRAPRRYPNGLRFPRCETKEASTTKTSAFGRPAQFQRLLTKSYASSTDCLQGFRFILLFCNVRTALLPKPASPGRGSLFRFKHGEDRGRRRIWSMLHTRDRPFPVTTTLLALTDA